MADSWRSGAGQALERQYAAVPREATTVLVPRLAGRLITRLGERGWQLRLCPGLHRRLHPRDRRSRRARPAQRGQPHATQAAQPVQASTGLRRT